jgi:8-oxo-dGTP pyrophosphatase MutT (NUDIX family)
VAHIHTEPGQHDHTASAFIVRNVGGEPKVLLHVHKKLGVLLQTGGHVELHETPLQAVLHEITEETGYELSKLRLLQPKLRLKKITGAVLHPQPLVYNTHRFDHEGLHRHTDVSFAFMTDSLPAGEPDEGESRDQRWIGLDELQLLGEEEIFANVREIMTYLIQEVLGEWEEVPLDSYEH